MKFSSKIEIGSFFDQRYPWHRQKYYKFPNLNVHMRCHSSRADAVFRFQIYPD